jgi:hypothetical protein
VNEALVAKLSHHALDVRVIGFGRGGAEGQRDRTEPEFEQPIAAAGLAVVIALGCRARDDFDLAVVQSEPPVDSGDLRFLMRARRSGVTSMVSRAEKALRLRSAWRDAFRGLVRRFSSTGGNGDFRFCTKP